MTDKSWLLLQLHFIIGLVLIYGSATTYTANNHSDMPWEENNNCEGCGECWE